MSAVWYHGSTEPPGRTINAAGDGLQPREAQLIPIIDPRRGDVEDDASSTKNRSLLSLFGTLLVEISLPKLVMTWVLLIVVPALMLGLTPIVASIWLHKVSGAVSYALVGLWSAILFALLVASGWVGGRWVLRHAEQSFWSLNSLAVQPCYAICREAVRHFGGHLLSAKSTDLRRSRLHAASAVVAGLLIAALAMAVLADAWPSARFITISDLAVLSAPKQVAIVALANSVVLVSAYVAGAVLVWGVADAAMGRPRDLKAYEPVEAVGRCWRIAHLSDVHVVGERYGFRVESGRLGPRGNSRLRRVLVELEAIHASTPLDAILITGDMTDAGRSTEWAEFLDAVAEHPALAGLMLMLPGNHDLNISDRANPARFDLPTSRNKALRRLRVLSAMSAIHGERVYVLDRARGRIGVSLTEALVPHIDGMAAFSHGAKGPSAHQLADLWNAVFPLVVPPRQDDGLGLILLDSNADTHFSFTNALGLISSEQVHGLDIAVAQYPRASWIIALHHHVVEYPWPTKALSERIGTALINGNWFIRRLRSLAGRAVVMHGHRHVDWIGECAGLSIVSAPSPVMEATEVCATWFYVHTFTTDPDNKLRLLHPQRVVIAGQPESEC
jgi:3',5'-cyclic AMP phosphodiesterase CpdA